MSEDPALNNTAPAQPRARSPIAIVLLFLLIAVVAYGVFERFRLVAAKEDEQKAIEVVRSLNGMTVESNSDDWRIIVVPDSPHLAKRIGGVFIPHEGVGPGYTDKVIEQLRAFGHCEDLTISSGPLSLTIKAPSVEKRVLKPGETPPELLDIAAIKKQFPHLKVTGEQNLVPSWEYPAETPAKDDASKEEKPTDQGESPPTESE